MQPAGERMAATAPATRPGPPRGRDRRWLAGGGVAGNEQLTAMTGAVLLVLLAVLGATVLRIAQLIWLHLFIGVLALGPLALKLASTGYRFLRYYSRNAAYRAKGPPTPLLRALGPLLVLSTAAVFASGIALLLEGPHHRSTALLLHKASFVVWLALTGVHVLAHLPGTGSSLLALRAVSSRRRRPVLPSHSRRPVLPSPAGETGRWLALAAALVAGVVSALALLSHFHAWTAAGAFPHHER